MLAYVLLVAQLPPAAPPTEFDEVVSIELDASDPVLAGHGPSERTEYM
jgi:hypothetical protein